MKTENLSIKIFADGANLASLEKLKNESYISGFTSNPSLMRQAGVEDFLGFCIAASEAVYPKPISVEVIADDFQEMAQQARLLGGLGENVFVKIPITNTKGESSGALIKALSADGIKLNITAVMTDGQFNRALESLVGASPAVISVFAGRIADTGVDPTPLMLRYASLISDEESVELLWASTREILNVVQAQTSNCDIITVPNNLLSKLSMFGLSLDELSLDTVKMFQSDAMASRYTLPQLN
jgi:transaldolase